MNRDIKKQFYVNADEDAELKRKADLVCLTEASLVRMLINNFEPKEKPGKEFYEQMNRITELANDLEKLSWKLAASEEAYHLLFMEAGKWNAFRSNIEEFFLRPKESELKWQ